MEPILYIQVGNVLWQVLSDGSWKEVSTTEFLNPNIETVVITSQEIGEGNVAQITSDTIEVDVQEILSRLSSSSQLPVTTDSTQNNSGDDSSDSASFSIFLEAILPETLVFSGYETRPFENDVNASFTQRPSPPERLNESATLTVTILDGGDGYENRFEVPSVTIRGDAIDIRDNWIVNIQVLDQKGNFVTATAKVQNERYQVSGVDLSSLAEGPLEVRARVSDVFETNLSATDTTVKDTLAAISAGFDGNGDEYLNQFEIDATTIRGFIVQVEDGQPIAISVKDDDGNILRFNSIVSGGRWEIENINLDDFSEGILTVTVETVDISGNPAVATGTIVKDTVAAINADVDDGGDGYLNIEERAAATFFGSVANIEDGQSVTITITDINGAFVTYSAVVNSGNWRIENKDLTSLDDGPITVSVSSGDIAGNPASASDSATTIDATLPTIDINTDIYIESGLGIANFRQGLITEMRGTTSGVAEGLSVTLRVSDGTNILTFSGNVDASGNWVINDIDIQQLNQTATWFIEAEVQDVAGNTVLDTMPTIILPDSESFSENIIGFYGQQSSTSNINIENGELSFNEDQSVIGLMTSLGQTIDPVVSPDGQTLVGISSDGRTVFDAKINGDGTVTITFYQAVDHDINDDDLVTAIIIKSVQSDLDGTEETVLARLPITIYDSDPIIHDETYSVIEDQTSSGNVLVNDIDFDGALYVRIVEAGGEQKTVPHGGSVTFSLSKGELTVYSNGDWVFEASRNLDNSIEQVVTFDYVAADTSIDYGTATATITIVDGQPGYVEKSTVSAVEVNLSDTHLSAIGTTNIVGGSDNPDPESLQFNQVSLVRLQALGLTSSLSNEALSYELNETGTEIIASVNGMTVFSLSLSGAVSGNNVIASVELNLQYPIDQFQSGDLVELPLTINARDIDNSTLISNQFTYVIQDGANQALVNAIVVEADESDLTSGSVSHDGSFNVTIGSDYVDGLYFSDANQPQLTSGGSEILYSVSLDGASIIGYILDSDGITHINVFQASLSSSLPITNDSDVTYTFELYRALDQSDSSAVSIPLVVIAEDSDLDKTQIELDITVNDNDNGDAAITNGTVELSEAPIDTAITPAGVSSTANVSVTVTASFDPIIYLGLLVSDGETVVDSNGNDVTHNGENLIWRDNGDGTYDAVLNSGVKVFEITLPSDFYLGSEQSAQVAVTIELYQPIDHLDGDGNEILIPVPVLTRDSDGTEVSSVSYINVYDGTNPQLSVNDGLTVNENGLVDDDLDRGTEQSSPSLSIVKGSDDVANITVDVSQFNSQNYRTSSGSLVTIGSADAQGWYYATDDSDQNVFRIRFNLDGTVEFELYQALMHQAPSGVLSDENELHLDFSITAVDADGDSSSSQTYTVTVIDDVPGSVEQTIELTEGDEYSGNWFSVHKNIDGADGAVITQLEYQGTVYDTGSAEFSGGTWTITLVNTSDGNAQYATLEMSQDGSFILNTELIVNTPIGGLLDELVVTIVDADGDQSNSTVELTLKDFEGFIRTVGVSTLEDNGENNGGLPNPLELPIRVFAGDSDDNEHVEEIRISVDSLQGGSLYLDGVLLTDDDDDGYINLRDSDGQLKGVSNFSVANGILTYQPLVNASNNTISVSLAISAVISSDTNPQGVILDTGSTVDIDILPVADAPEWSDQSEFSYETVEDSGDATLLNIVADLFDIDGSETLHYELSNIPDGLIITLNGSAIIEGKSYTQAQLNQMEITSEQNVAGQFTFDIRAVSTESGTVFDSETDQTADITHQVVVNVSPDADTPTLSVSNIKGLEDQVIDLNGYIVGSLTDIDGSETLCFRVEVQDGWTLPVGNGITLVATNTYLVTAQALANSQALLQPKEDISSYTESLSITVTAISTESMIDGLDPINETAESAPQVIEIHLKGVVDVPEVVDGGQGHWQYDNSTQIISNASPLNEDNLIQLDFIINTSDDDQSEEINILLSGIPEGTSLVDSNGAPVSLAVAYIDATNGPTYQISNSQLANTYLKPATDFSGELTLKVTVVSTEPDGDSGEFSLTVEMNVSPVVDQQDGLVIHSQGVEDNGIKLKLEPVVDQDNDGSESLTGYTIVSLPDELTLYFDDVEINASSLPFDLSTLLDGTSQALNELLNSGRLTVIASEDLSGEFNVEVSYQVTDTSPTGDVDVKELSATLTVTVEGKVDIGSEDVDKTRLDGAEDVFISSDGSPVDISGGVTFTELDLDGSEYIDYIVLQFSGDYNLVVSHPNGVSQDANGNWLIPMGDITSDSIVETAQDLLAGATISSSVDTEVIDVTAKAYVKDGSDSQYITDQFQIQITGNSGDGTGCADPGTPGSVQGQDILAREGEDIAVGQYLNSDVESSPDNLVSFFIPSDSLPDGVEIEGEGVTPAYDISGNLLGYSVTGTGLDSIRITGVDEDFSGCINFTIEVTETAPCDGDTKTTAQTITIQIAPVVDDITISPTNVVVQEDTVSTLNLELILGDSIADSQIIRGEGESSTGKETVNWVTLSVSNGASISAVDNALITDNGDGTWTITDVSRLNEIQVLPAEHYSGEIVLTVEANITDEVTGSCLSGENAVDTQTKETTVTIVVEPVVDKANLVSEDVTGNEDNYIYLGNLKASLFDQDGSESMSLIIKGVPQGAVLVWDNNGTYELLPNNGSNSANETEWQITQEQLDNIYLLPPLDFSGDVTLTLEAITQELGTDLYNYTTSEFTVGVLPVGDSVELNQVSESISGSESEVIHIDFVASSFETNSNEYLEVSMIVNASSDPSAFDGLGRIRIGNQFALFSLDANGNAVATILVRADEVNGLDFIPGDAFGQMDVTLSVRTYDQSVVQGNSEQAYGEAETSDLTITITPEPDEPILTAEYNSIVAEASGVIGLGLDMNLVHPSDQETGQITISGIPQGLELSHGSYQNGVYTVELSDVSDLSIIGGYTGADDFSLTVIPMASIGEQTASGLAQTIFVSLVETGDSTILASSADDLLIGGSGNDKFYFDTDGLGTTLNPSFDVISDFQISLSGGDNDTIDLSAIITATDIIQLDNKLDLTQTAEGTIVNLKPDQSGTQQQILLENVTFDDLYQADASGASEADILQKMIDDNNLIVSGVS
ncbi:Ig-like domain-containing protein [Vibrio diazotrophicus]|uniref:T1SS-143 repeat domain-containing protein n=1 Tax=Vibrio diazotrophicus TaxID=685 RepID=UPI0005AAA74B|nr:type I secretion C-terminal target domain-containing protein [Vibrio diazotrophicus]